MSNETVHTSILNELTFRVAESPTAQERALGLLLDAAGDQVTESQVREALDLPKSTVNLALSSLVSEGLAEERRVGRTKLYSANIDDPLIKTLKVAHAIRRVQSVIAEIRDSLDLVVLFGSASRGENRVDSDVDVLVVATDAAAALEELARHQWLQPVVMTSEEHMALIAEGGTFASELARGITLWERW